MINIQRTWNRNKILKGLSLRGVTNINYNDKLVAKALTSDTYVINYGDKYSTDCFVDRTECYKENMEKLDACCDIFISGDNTSYLYGIGFLKEGQLPIKREHIILTLQNENYIVTDYYIEDLKKEK